MMYVHRVVVLAAVVVTAGIVLAACQPQDPQLVVFVTATAPAAEAEAGPATGVIPEAPPPATLDPLTAPTPNFVPTPNPTRVAIVDPTEDQIHVVQFGDTLGVIAQRYGVTVDDILAVNDLPNANMLAIGQPLIIPLGIQTVGPAFKIIPDSELVYGPGVADFDVAAFVAGSDSFLAEYTESFRGRTWTGAEMIEQVALEQSINPRLLLTMLEYESGWLTRSTIPEDDVMYPMNYLERPDEIYGLYRQLDWAAKQLQVGYYGWRLRGLGATILEDGTRAGLAGTLNAGTAGVQVYLARTRTADQWMVAAGHTGFFATYVSLFGDPFQYAVEPLIPTYLEQPPLALPWAPDETWYFTGGPHGGWGSGSAWAALDFVPVSTPQGCTLPEEYARAVADGVIASSRFGHVIIDLDGDGDPGTGWTIFYLHIATEGRAVAPGQRVEVGDPIGLPSCEGGISFASHLHIARRYNGEWIPADCTNCLPTIPTPQLNFEGWVAYELDREYNGQLVRGAEWREACVCRDPINTFSPADRIR